MTDPILDFRSAETFYQQALELAQAYAPEWSTYWPAVLTQPLAEQDPAAAAQAVNQDPGLVLLNLFAQLAGYTAGIENQIPNQRRQAFFQFMNMQLRAPIASQAPLQFMLAPEKAAKLVPAQSGVEDAARQSIRFQTNADLLVVPATLCAAMTIIPPQDQFIDAMPVMVAAQAAMLAPESTPSGAPPTIPLFVANQQADPAEQPLPHWFMMGDAALFKPDPALQSIAITLHGKNLYGQYFGQWFDGALMPLTATLTESPDAQRLEIQLTQKPLAEPVTIGQLQQELYTLSDPDAGFDQAPLAQQDDVPEYWLLVKPDPQVKVISSLAQQLPVITGLSCTFKGDYIQPQQAAFNQVLLDISNGAYPFGETPKQDDGFYLRSDTIFARVGAQVFIAFDFTPVAQQFPVTLTWQFWDGKKWQGFNQTLAEASQYQFVDTTNNFQYNNIIEPTGISFQCPQMGETTVAGGKGLWIRVVIASGGYGAASGFVTTSVADTIEGIPPAILTQAQKDSVIAYLNNVEGVNFSYQFNQAQFFPPYIKALQMTYTYAAQPTRLWSYNAFQLSRFLFSPFKPVDERLTGFYFAFAPGDFGLYTLGNKLTLYFYLQQECAQAGAGLLWQYHDGKTWQNLSVDDGTEGLSRSGVASFMVPAAMPVAYLYSQSAYWFRIMHPQAAGERTIRVFGMYPNTVMASNITGVDDEVLGSSNEQPAQSFALSYTPVLPTLDLLVYQARGLDDQAARSSLASGIAAQSPLADAGELIGLAWKLVDNFAFCGPTDRVYTLDCKNGLITFGDGYNGLIPPRGFNNIVAAHYDTTLGLGGNLGAGHLTLLRPGISDIDSVNNPAPASGGVDGDSVADIAANSPALVRAGGYAVELSDLSALAAQASQQVAQARAIEGADQRISIVLLALARDPIPTTTPLMQSQVLASVKLACLAPLAERIVTGVPDFVAIDVTAQLSVKVRPDQKNALEQRIVQQLQAYFQPVFGGPDGAGWRFGQTVLALTLNRFLRAMPEVEAVLGLNLNGQQNGNIAMQPNQLPVAGQMTILLYLE